MWFIGVEVEQETSAPPPKKILDPPLGYTGKNCSIGKPHNTFIEWIQQNFHGRYPISFKS